MISQESHGVDVRTDTLQHVVAGMPLNCIREIRGSNLCRVSSYTDRFFVVSFCLPS
jgi:hypothetical protein